MKITFFKFPGYNRFPVFPHFGDTMKNQNIVSASGCSKKKIPPFLPGRGSGCTLPDKSSVSHRFQKPFDTLPLNQQENRIEEGFAETPNDASISSKETAIYTGTEHCSHFFICFVLPFNLTDLVRCGHFLKISRDSAVQKKRVQKEKNMKPFLRWTRLPMVLVLLSSAFLLNCGSDSEEIVGCAIPSISFSPGDGCNHLDYQPGLLTITITANDTINDGCDVIPLIPGGIIGQTLSVNLPPLENLPENIEVDVPIIGKVLATFTRDGEEIKLIGRVADSISSGGVSVYFEAIAVGSICFFDASGSFKAKLAIVLESVSPQVLTPCCVVTISLTR